MKKTYMQPQIEVAIMRAMSIICGSDDIKSSKGIDYGGVDENGTKDPDSRRVDYWEDEEDEDY